MWHALQGQSSCAWRQSGTRLLRSFPTVRHATFESYDRTRGARSCSTYWSPVESGILRSQRQVRLREFAVRTSRAGCENRCFLRCPPLREPGGALFVGIVVVLADATMCVSKPPRILPCHA